MIGVRSTISNEFISILSHSQAVFSKRLRLRRQLTRSTYHVVLSRNYLLRLPGRPGCSMCVVWLSNTPSIVCMKQTFLWLRLLSNAGFTIFQRFTANFNDIAEFHQAGTGHTQRTRTTLADSSTVLSSEKFGSEKKSSGLKNSIHVKDKAETKAPIDGSRETQF